MWDIFNKNKVQALKEKTEYLKGQVHILKEDREEAANHAKQLEKELAQKVEEYENFTSNLKKVQSQVEDITGTINLKVEVQQRLLDDFKSLLILNKDKKLDCSGIRVAEEVAKEVADISTFEITIVVEFFKNDAAPLLRHFKSFVNSEFSHDIVDVNSMYVKKVNTFNEKMIANFSIHTFDSLKKVESDILNFLYKHGTTIINHEVGKDNQVSILGKAPLGYR